MLAGMLSLPNGDKLIGAEIIRNILLLFPGVKNAMKQNIAYTISHELHHAAQSNYVKNKFKQENSEYKNKNNYKETSHYRIFNDLSIIRDNPHPEDLINELNNNIKNVNDSTYKIILNNFKSKIEGFYMPKFTKYVKLNEDKIANLGFDLKKELYNPNTPLQKLTNEIRLLGEDSREVVVKYLSDLAYVTRDLVTNLYSATEAMVIKTDTLMEGVKELMPQLYKLYQTSGKNIGFDWENKDEKCDKKPFGYQSRKCGSQGL